MKNQASSQTNPQAGSVILLIFIAIFLFGLLSFVLAQSFRGTGATITQENAKIAASEIMVYAQSLRNGMKAMIINGTPINQLDFVMTTLTKQNGTPETATNTNCASDACRIFKPQGGGVTEKLFYDYGIPDVSWDPTSVHVGGFEFILARVEGFGTNLPEIVMAVVQVKPEICAQLNVLMGLGSGTIHESNSGNTHTNYKGNVDTILNSTTTEKFGISEPKLYGKNTFCDTSNRMAYLVLQAR